MHLCLKCNSKIPNKIKINGKSHGLRKRKFCLSCSPFKSGNCKDLRMTEVWHPTNDTKRCSKCQEVFPMTSEYFHRDKGKRDGFCWYCKKCNNEITKAAQKNFKKVAVEHKGGKCISCGENALCCLDFHHLDPTKKDYSISSDLRNLGRLNDKAKTELDKCILLCSNCHRKVHAGIIKQEGLIGRVGNAPTYGDL